MKKQAPYAIFGTVKGNFKSSRNFVGIVAIMLLAFSCQPAVQKKITHIRPPIYDNTPLTVLQPNQGPDKNAEFVGSVNVGEGGFTTRCSYQDVMRLIDMEARKSGANLIHIISHKEPDLTSKCHRISAKLYYTKVGYTVQEEISDWHYEENEEQREEKIEAIEEGNAGKPETDAPVVEDSSGIDNASSRLADEQMKTPQTSPAIPASSQTIIAYEEKDGQKNQEVSKYFNQEELLRAPPSIRGALLFGYSRRISRLPENVSNDYREYLNQLRNGSYYGAELMFKLDESTYLGARFDQFNARNEAMVTVSIPGMPGVSGTIRDHVRIGYYGIGMQRVFKLLRSNSEFYWGGSLAYTTFRDAGVGVFENGAGNPEFQNYEITGASLGYRFDGGYGIELNPGMYLAAQVGFATGYIGTFELTLNNGPSNTITANTGEGEGLLRFEAGLALRFTF